jgi:hypothetical protein
MPSSDGSTPPTRSIMPSSSSPSSTAQVGRAATLESRWIGALHLLIHSCVLLVCPQLLGRFRVLDRGNTPVGSSENVAFIRCAPWLRPSLKLLADVAYSSDPRCRCPYKAPQLTIEAAGSAGAALRRRTYNQQLSSERIKVEHAFSRLKHTFRLLQHSWNMPLAQLPDTFRAAALLCNWLARTRNLYTI